MILGRVVGDITATRKHEALQGHKLLIVQPLTAKLEPRGGCVVAVDSAQAGAGDTVLVCDEGNAARLILQDRSAPVRTMVVGIVDSVEAAAGMSTEEWEKL